MATCYYKFCYWLGVRLGIRRLEAWAYLNWFRVEGTDDIFKFFKFSENYFKFCKKWGIGDRLGKNY